MPGTGDYPVTEHRPFPFGHLGRKRLVFFNGKNHPSLPIERVNIYVHSVTSAEFKRWLERQGATFEPAKGGHIWVMLRGRRTILPMHGRRKELKTGTVAAIKKQLGVQ